MRLWFAAVSYDREGEVTDHGVVGSSAVAWDERLDGFDEAVKIVQDQLGEAQVIEIKVTIGA